MCLGPSAAKHVINKMKTIFWEKSRFSKLTRRFTFFGISGTICDLHLQGISTAFHIFGYDSVSCLTEFANCLYREFGLAWPFWAFGLAWLGSGLAWFWLGLAWYIHTSSYRWKQSEHTFSQHNFGQIWAEGCLCIWRPKSDLGSPNVVAFPGCEREAASTTAPCFRVVFVLVPPPWRFLLHVLVVLFCDICCLHFDYFCLLLVLRVCVFFVCSLLVAFFAVCFSFHLSHFVPLCFHVAPPPPISLPLPSALSPFRNFHPSFFSALAGLMYMIRNRTSVARQRKPGGNARSAGSLGTNHFPSFRIAGVVTRTSHGRARRYRDIVLEARDESRRAAETPRCHCFCGTRAGIATQQT